MTNFGLLSIKNILLVIMAQDILFAFEYEGYVRSYGHSKRPALVRYGITKTWNEDGSTEYQTECRLYIDGKTISHYSDYDQNLEDSYKYDIVIVSPEEGNDDLNMVARSFNHSYAEDWYYLFHDCYQFSRMGDRLAYALIVRAFDMFNLNIQLLSDAINGFQEPVKSEIITIIRYASYGLSKNKINQINTLSQSFGIMQEVTIPPILEVAAKELEIEYEDLNVHSLAALLVDTLYKKEILEPNGFSRLIHWFKNDNYEISLEEIGLCFPYLSEYYRAHAIRRIFFDIKKGVFQYSEKLQNMLFTDNYKYYSNLRYIFEMWPGNRNVSLEFLFDCIETYKNTNQKHFQVSNGVLDWAIQKAIEVNRPIQLKFNDWLSRCEGGVVINPEFQGFAHFFIQHELDDFAFEEEQLKKSVHSIVNQYCERLYQDKDVMRENSRTGKPEIVKERIFLDQWRVRKPEYLPFVNLFVIWDKRENSRYDMIFTPEMVDYSIVRGQVEKYLMEKYSTTTPYISERQSDPIVKMFSYEVRMRARMNEKAILGIKPEVVVSDVKQNIKNRLIELFGNDLDCEYDAEKYQIALRDTLFRLRKFEPNCFKLNQKSIYNKFPVFCAPKLSEHRNFLTGRQFAICERDVCFMTCIKKNPEWRNYTLLHILEILGYDILEETEAGYMPNDIYNMFATQIRKAEKLYKNIVCKECGHVLFPAEPGSRSKFKCLLPSCSQYGKQVYLNFCYECRWGIIDSRVSHRCPNGMHICPSCGSCCSNEYFQRQAENYHIMGENIPKFISSNIGKGHKNQNKFFCFQCGSQKMDYIDEKGNHQWRCFKCNPIKENLPE